VNLAIDIGNTSVHAGVFAQNILIRTFRYHAFNPPRIRSLRQRYFIQNVIVSSVNDFNPRSFSILSRQVRCFMEFSSQTPIPIENLYKTPDTLGKDRLAGVTGGQSLFPGRPLLVIDAGTAITYDFLNAAGQYQGGNISPGLTMRLGALHKYTRRLPRVQPRRQTPVMADNTVEAIAAGVQNGIIYEMNQYIEHFTNQYPGLITILTGGDSFFFDNKLKYPIFVEPNLILIGLNKILKYNLYAH